MGSFRSSHGLTRSSLIAALLLVLLLPARAADFVVLIEGEAAGHLKVQRDGSRYGR